MSTQTTRTRMLPPYRTIITLNDDLNTLTDDAGVGQYLAKKLMDFPANAAIQVHSVTFNGSLLALTPFINTWDGDWAVGWTAATTGDKSAAANYLTAPAAIPQAVAKLGSFKGVSAGGVHINPASLYLNVWTDDNVAHATTAGNKLNGTAVIIWNKLGSVS